MANGTQRSFTPAINYGLHGPLLMCNIVLIIVNVWYTRDFIQDEISSDGEAAVMPYVVVVLASLSAIYGVIFLTLEACMIKVPPLARILVDSLYLIPWYIVLSGLYELVPGLPLNNMAESAGVIASVVSHLFLAFGAVLSIVDFILSCVYRHRTLTFNKQQGPGWTSMEPTNTSKSTA